MKYKETIALDLRFHPVGQGLFTSGHIRSFDGSTNFNWVYDCGTSSSQTFVDTSILRLESDVASDCLNLVIISHFDHDHISGLVKLLSKFKIKTLLLPHMPLWQRLHCAFVESVDTQDALMELFLDPVAYVLALEGGDKIEQIVLVPPSTESPPGDEEGEAPIEGGEIPITFEFGDPPDDEGELALNATKRKWLKPNGKILLNGVWEFVPYNDAEAQPDNTAEFRNKVDTVATNLLSQPDNAGRKLALKELKSIYDREFGKSAIERNVISLFLYGGPIGKGHSILGPCQSTCFYRIADPFFWHEVLHGPAQMNGRRVGFLMTGDGYLNSPERLRSLVQYFEPHGRLSKVSALQVMHHGSNKNWHKGVASTLSPDYSVFSSDPNHARFGHPNRDVVEDFICYGPQQVDRRRGFSLSSVLWKK